MSYENFKNKKVVIIMASSKFRDEEYFVPKEIFEKAGIEVKTASNKEGQAIGVNGGEVNIDFNLKNLNVRDFEAVVFVGGPGALKYLDNKDSYKIINETLEKQKLLASICISPVILARAGVLVGKRATVWSSPFDKSAVKILKENGAIYEDSPVVIDGDIITADGPSSAGEFAGAIVNKLRGD